ncbi:MAG: hypothetical protein WCX79_04400 [Candidatus Paceibacterota bacterium]|jgi:hypothetical protein
MINNTAEAFFEPRRGYIFPEDCIGREEMITSRQRRILSDLIYSNIEDEDNREGYLAQLSDLSRTEADDLMLEFTMGKWR